jgi:hypothetical protein
MFHPSNLALKRTSPAYRDILEKSIHTTKSSF